MNEKPHILGCILLRSSSIMLSFTGVMESVIGAESVVSKTEISNHLRTILIQLRRIVKNQKENIVKANQIQ